MRSFKKTQHFQLQSKYRFSKVKRGRIDVHVPFPTHFTWMRPKNLIIHAPTETRTHTHASTLPRVQGKVIMSPMNGFQNVLHQSKQVSVLFSEQPTYVSEFIFLSFHLPICAPIHSAIIPTQWLLLFLQNKEEILMTCSVSWARFLLQQKSMFIFLLCHLHCYLSAFLLKLFYTTYFNTFVIPK